MKRKEELEKQKRKGLIGLTEEDREIMKKVKGQKKEAKRQRARETDEFDELMAKYKSKVLKSLKKKVAEGIQDKGEPEFEEIEMSD